MYILQSHIERAVHFVGMGKMEPRPSSSNLHQSDADEEDENVKQLDECSVLYLSLQDCLVKTNRNWKSCQMGCDSFEKESFLKNEVKALKACHDKRNNEKRK